MEKTQMNNMCPHENTHVEVIEYDQRPEEKGLYTQTQVICDDCGACVEVLEED